MNEHLSSSNELDALNEQQVIDVFVKNFEAKKNVSEIVALILDKFHSSVVLQYMVGVYYERELDFIKAKDQFINYATLCVHNKPVPPTI